MLKTGLDVVQYLAGCLFQHNPTNNAINCLFGMVL